MPKIYFRGNIEQAREQVYLVVRSICGNSKAKELAARRVHTSIGLQALSDIKDDFVRKAQGGTGEDGVKWPKLSRKYLAYGRRFGDGEKQNLKQAAGLGLAHFQRGLLTDAQNKRWKKIFATRLARLAASMSIGDAKARAAQIAWAVLKREGAKTKLMVFGNRQVEILRDTGVLLNSLSPGKIGGDSQYDPPESQIFKLVASGVIVGTNVPYAAVHQNGSKKKNIPARPFLPTAEKPACSEWVNRWAEVGRDATRFALIAALEGNE